MRGKKKGFDLIKTHYFHFSHQITVCFYVLLKTMSVISLCFIPIYYLHKPTKNHNINHLSLSHRTLQYVTYLSLSNFNKKHAHLEFMMLYLHGSDL